MSVVVAHHCSATSNETRPIAYSWLAHAATPHPIPKVSLWDTGTVYQQHVLLCYCL